MTTVTNISTGPRGIYTSHGLVMFEVGETRDDLEIDKAELKDAKATGWFDLDGGPLDHDDDGEKGGVATTEPVGDEEMADLLEAMSDDDLRIFITDRDGKAPHPRTGRDKLLATARGD